MVSIGLLLFATFMATNAGRLHESGTGAMWIAPELVGDDAQAKVCGQVASLTRRELVFETLHADAIEDELPLLASGLREVVSFEWDPATGELSFRPSATTGVFSDLAPAAPLEGGQQLRSCGSH